MSTYALGVAIADWHFGTWDTLHTIWLLDWVVRDACANVVMASFGQCRDIEGDNRMHLSHLASPLHAGYLDQLRLAIDIEFENFLFDCCSLLLRWINHAESHRCSVLIDR